MTADDLVSRLTSGLHESVDEVLTREQHEFSTQLVPFQDRVVLFGAGTWGRRAASALAKSGIRPLAFSDNDPRRWGTSVCGLPILAPHDAASRFGSNALFVVTIWNALHSYQQTELQLRAAGCQGVVPFSCLAWKFAEEFLPYFCLDRPHKVYSAMVSVLQCARLWADDESRQEFFDQIIWRARGSWNFSRHVDPGQYFSPELISLTDDEFVVDCGAYDGDTLRDFISLRDYRFRTFFAIKPDPDSFSRLVTYVNDLAPETRTRVHALQAAVGAVRQSVRFSAVGRPDSHQSADGGIAVRCATLDELLKTTTGVTLIKMDIEGAERGALDGARSTIARDSPVLAVCVYHTPSDLWEIPVMMRALAPNHDLFLRRHRPDCWETVAYAIPVRRSKARADS